MDGLLSEKEQIEAMRQWWRENGRYIISGLVIGAGLLFGWNYWQGQQEQSSREASVLFEALAEHVAATRLEPARETARRLVDEYGSTVYAGQARLAMARLYMDMGRDRDAAEELRAIVEQGRGDGEVELLARLRLGKILLYQDRPEEVVELLQGFQDTAFAARYSETLGDALVALGRQDEAVEAYTVALADSPNAPTVDRELVQMKINDLRTAPPVGGDVAGEQEAAASEEPEPPAGTDE